MSSETTTLINHTPAALWLPTRRRGGRPDGEKYGDCTAVPPKTREGVGRLDGVPTWYLDELVKERAWSRRFESGEVTIGGGPSGRPRNRAEVRAEHAEDEARALREKARADDERIARLEAELAAAKKPATDTDSKTKPEKAESKKS